jgi:putative two-component system response regulator
LTSSRPYKDPYPPEMVYDIIRREREEHFDPDITDVFLKNFDTFVEIRKKSGDPTQLGLENFKLSERDQICIQT